MSAPIDLAELRDRLDSNYAPDWGILALPTDVVVAFVEAVEAAQALVDAFKTDNVPYRRTHDARTRLDASLSAFAVPGEPEASDG